jgi:hypothetical protein
VRLRVHPPYRHWLAGMTFELAAFTAFIVLTTVVAIAVAFLAR